MHAPILDQYIILLSFRKKFQYEVKTVNNSKLEIKIHLKSNLLNTP